MTSSWEAYLKAADQQAWPRSDASTATASSCTSYSSLARTPLSSKAKLFAPTPLSSKATPFKSSLDRRPSYPENGQQQGGTIGLMPIFMPGSALPVPSYSEEVQENVYMSQGSSDLRYSETLQENVYLDANVGLNDGSPFGISANSQSHRGRAALQEDRIAMPSRTPSPPEDRIAMPPTASNLIAEVATAAASLWSIAASTLAESMNRPSDDMSHVFSMPVKRTFIHYDTPWSDIDLSSGEDDFEFQRLSKSTSAPSILLHDVNDADAQSMADLHVRGECTPCAYFCSKQDGCRWGEDCKFCHMCPPDEIKKRKKAKVKAARKRRLLEQKVASSPAIFEHALGWS